MSENRHEVMIGGTGGQGVLSIGYVLADAALTDYKHVTRFPIYLAMQRGGSAFCTVIFSKDEIAAPILSTGENAIAMELGSYTKFKDCVKKGGRLVYNSSIVKEKDAREKADITQYAIPVIELATELGNPAMANIVMLGAYIQITKAIPDAIIRDSIKTIMAEEASEERLKKNILAYEKGIAYAKAQNW